MAVSRTHKDALMVCAYQLVETCSDLHKAVWAAAEEAMNKDSSLFCDPWLLRPYSTAVRATCYTVRYTSTGNQRNRALISRCFTSKILVKQVN